MLFFFQYTHVRLCMFKESSMMPIVDMVSGDKISSIKTKSLAANHSVCHRFLCTDLTDLLTHKDQDD